MDLEHHDVVILKYLKDSACTMLIQQKSDLFSNKRVTNNIEKLLQNSLPGVSEWVNWLFNVTINDISVIHVTAHGDSDTPPHLVAFYDHAGDTEVHILDLTPRALTGVFAWKF